MPQSGQAKCSQPSQENPHHLHDAQGAKIEVKGLRDVRSIMQTEEGHEVQAHECLHFADEVRQPILSFGRLVAGWGIDGQEKLFTLGRKLRFPYRRSARV